MAGIGDPVGSGFVTSLAHPGGTMTGTAIWSHETADKQLEIVKEAVPHIQKVGVLRLDTFHEVRYPRLLKTAARLNLMLTAAEIGTSTGLLHIFSDWRANGVDAFLVVASPVLDDMRDEIAELGLRYKLPGAGHQPYYVQAGVLLSYGPSVGDLHSRSAGYVDKLLKGARPADLPVEQADRFKLVVNLKTAAALGLAIPPTLIARADEVIE